MLKYDLLKVANQQFSGTANGNAFVIRLRTFRDLTYVSIAINGTDMECSVRATPNASLFNSEVNRLIGGCFMFKCTSDDYPHYSNFDGVSCILVYVPESEL